jgi:5-formyltetrahydrofolate cyclo-ligase
MVKISEANAKSALRRTMRGKRTHFADSLPHFARDRSFTAIPSALIPLLSDVTTAGLYAPYGDEAPVLRYLEPLASLGISTALPAIHGKDIVFRAFAPEDELVTGQLGVMEPSEEKAVIIPEVIFMPLLAFDHDGHRLGQGGGFYDRYLTNHPKCGKIGFGWSVQQVDKVPIEPHDQRLDAVITEQYVTIFGQ